MLEIILAFLTLLGAFLAGWFYRKPAAKPPKETPIIPPEINHADTHKMDDAVLPQPAATHSAEQLRKWARQPDDVRHED